MASLIGKAIDPIISTAEKLSKIHRIAIFGGTFLVLIGLFAWLFYLPKVDKIYKLKVDIEDSERKLLIATQKANQLARYRDMKKKEDANFRIAKKALPNKKEIPSLLTGITNAGKDAGLEFLMFKPEKEVQKDFYAEIPVAIKVQGSYHDVAVFFDKVSRLFRVVNITNIKMQRTKNKKIVELNTSCKAITYKFVEPKPKKTKKKPKNKKKK